MTIIPEITLTFQGELLKFSRRRPKSGGGRRGRVIQRQRSTGSRRRQMQAMCLVDWDTLINDGWVLRWVTLTTPPPAWGNRRGAYQALRRVLADVRRRGGFAFVTRELGQRRGMLHYHILAAFSRSAAAWAPQDADASQRPGQQNDLAVLWSSAIGFPLTRVEVEIIHQSQAERRYLCKYIAKTAYTTIDDMEKEGGGQIFSATKEPEENSSVAVSCSSHITGNDGHNGNRWWYLAGRENVVYADILTISGEQAREIAYRFRRIWRKLERQRVKWAAAATAVRKIQPSAENRDILRLFSAMYGDKTHNLLRAKCAQSRALRYFSKGFNGGFSIMGSASDLWQIFICLGVDFQQNLNET